MGLVDWTPEKICGALLHLQQSGAFKFTNKDNAILASFAKKLKGTGYLTDRQIDFARYKMRMHMKALQKADFVDFALRGGTDRARAGELQFSLHNRKKFRVYLARKAKSVMPVVRSLDGLDVSDDGTYYLCSATKRNGHVLLNSGFVADTYADQWMQQPSPAWPKIALNDLCGRARDFQVDGVSFLLSRGGRALLADEMGLGKTMQAIAWAKMAEACKICIVCLASLKTNWKREITLWTAEKSICVLSGQTPTPEQIDDLHLCRWIVINYDILQYWCKALVEAGVTSYVFDECQAIKNTRALRTQAAQYVTKDVEHVLGLSGTPIENRPIELYSMIKMIDPMLFPIKAKYENRYCLRTLKDGSYDYQGASNTKELNRILVETIMLRRRKVDVLSELPDKTRAVVPVDMSNNKDWNTYYMAEHDFMAWVKNRYPNMTTAQEKRKAKAQAIMKMNALKQLAARAKLPLVFEWIDNYLGIENKLVVFAYHHEIIDAIYDRYPKSAVILDGRTPQDNRQKMVDLFQTDPRINLFVGNLAAAGKGHTLTAAKDTLTVEFGWTSALHDQAEDRVHRMGQKNTVTAYYMIVQDTIEEKISLLLDKKRGILSEVLDGEGPVDEDLLIALLDMYSGPRKGLCAK